MPHRTGAERRCAHRSAVTRVVRGSSGLWLGFAVWWVEWALTGFAVWWVEWALTGFAVWWVELAGVDPVGSSLDIASTRFGRR